jgi:hypothetical protein
MLPTNQNAKTPSIPKEMEESLIGSPQGSPQRFNRVLSKVVDCETFEATVRKEKPCQKN